MKDLSDADIAAGIAPETPASEPPRHWGYRDLMVFFAFAGVALVASIGLMMVGFDTAKLLFGFEGTANEGSHRLPIVLAVQMVWWALVLYVIHRTVTVRYGLPFAESLAWRPFRGPGLTYLSLGVLLALSVTLVSNLIPMPEETLPIEELLSEPGALLLFALFGVAVAPAVEELVFRGFLYPVVERSHGPAAAVVATSTLFSLLHFGQYGGHWQILLLLFAVGAVLGAVRAWSGSVQASTIVHAAYNATFLIGLHFASRQAAAS